jgi:hypothetical protein
MQISTVFDLNYSIAFLLDRKLKMPQETNLGNGIAS